MIFEEHSELEGKHAVFAPSSPSWLRYDPEKIINRYIESYASEIGTALHELAADLISEKETLNKSDKKVVIHHLRKAGYDRKLIKRYSGSFYPIFSAYVNDAIALNMQSEVKLYYSEISFGTADAIQFYPEKQLLEIHDLKTGMKPAKMEQLEVYAALYCLQYKQDPLKTNFELRIYQNDQVLVHTPDPADIRRVCDTIVYINKVIRDFKEGK